MKSRLSTRLAAAEDMAAYRGVRVSLNPRYVPVATNPERAQHGTHTSARVRRWCRKGGRGATPSVWDCLSVTASAFWRCEAERWVHPGLQLKPSARHGLWLLVCHHWHTAGAWGPRSAPRRDVTMEGARRRM